MEDGNACVEGGAGADVSPDGGGMLCAAQDVEEKMGDEMAGFVQGADGKWRIADEIMEEDDGGDDD